MPAPELSDMYQDAVLWARTGADVYGTQKVANPVPVKVTWKWTRGEVLDPKGNVVKVDATATIDQDVAVGSLMWLGVYPPPDPPVDVCQVVSVASTPDVKNRYTQRTLSLMRFKDTVPGAESESLGR